MDKSRPLATLGFLTPGVGLLTVFIIIPIIFTGWVSLNHWSMMSNVTDMEFVGLANYKEIFGQGTFRKTLMNTFIFSGLNLFIMVPLAVLIGLLLYHSKILGNSIVRTLIFLPYIIPPVAVAIVWGNLYSPLYGPLNEIFSLVGLPAQDWLSSVDQAMMSIIILNIWQTLGYYVVIVLAGLTEIPEDYYEAASIDGSNIFQKFIFITVPLLKRSLSFIVVIMTINTLQVFDPIYVLTQGGPANSTNVVSYHMYDTAFNFGNAGQATAMAFVLFIVVLLFTILQLRILKSNQ